jgi:hypothetical protein
MVLMLTLWGCDNLSEPAGKLVGPTDQSNILIIGKGPRGSTIARESDPTVGFVTAEIDKKGGALSIGDHVLYIPAGAVEKPTTFRMRKMPGDIKVGLTATRKTPNDVGHAGFNVPVYLTLSYANGQNMKAIGQLKILWIKPDGSTEAQPSQVKSSDKVVVGELTHFTDFGLGWP